MPSRDPEITPRIRGVFLPEDGEYWGKTDYRQQEMLLVVHYAAELNLTGAAELVELYKNDPTADFHAVTATKTGLTRTIAKTVNFLIIYGGGPVALAEQTGKSIAEATEIIDEHRRGLPCAYELSERLKQVARGYIKLGGDNARQHFNLYEVRGIEWGKGTGPCLRDEADRRVNDSEHPWYRRQLVRARVYKALNALIQSTGARQAKLLMLAGWNEGIVPLFMMHDGLDFSVTSPKIPERVAQLGAEVMPLRVPMRMDVTYGKNWADATHTWAEVTGQAASEAPSANAAHSTGNGASAGQPSGAETKAPPPPPPDPPKDDPRDDPPPDDDQADDDDSLDDDVPPGGSGTAGGHDDEFEDDEPASGKAAKPAKPYNDAHLKRAGYQEVEPNFDYKLPDGTVLYQKIRYELKPGIPEILPGRPRKTFGVCHKINGIWMTGAGPRHIPFNWTRLLCAPPGSNIFAVEGEGKVIALHKAGLLGTTTSFHEWTAESINALAGHHVFVLADHDKQGIGYAKKTLAALAPVAASVRIVRYKHLWQHLPAEKRGDKPRPHEDIANWLNPADRGGDPAKLLWICQKVPASGTELDEFDVGELLESGQAPPRQWLSGRYFCLKFVSGLVAPGDSGKTTLRLTQAIEIALGRSLLGYPIYRRCKVLIVSFEDDKDELHRRLDAICRHHNIKPSELKGWLKCRDLNNGIKLASLDDKGRPQIGPLDTMLRRAIKRTGCEFLVLDPFVKIHALMENDNPQMDFVFGLLTKMAQDLNIAVDCPAHTHKGAIVAGDADARRGASAQRDAGRLDYTLIRMTEDEAEAFGIHPDDRKDYVRLDKAKANMVRAAKARWFRLVSVPLGNATKMYPDGDDVQAIEKWGPPDTWQGASPETLNAILDAIDRGMPDGRRYSDNSRSGDRAAWKVVQEYCPDKPESACKEMIKAWMKKGAGVLFREDYDDPIRHDKQKGLFVDHKRRPKYSTRKEEGRQNDPL
jgi:hypothetical protein